MSKIKLSENIVKDVSTFIFQPGNGVHDENINIALQYMKNIPGDVSIISGDNEEIQTNKYLLSVFSPILRNLLTSTCDTSQIIFFPDSSTLSIRNLLNIINSGFSVTEKISNEDITEITETALLLSIDIKELRNDENIPSLDKANQDIVSIGVSIRANTRNKFSSEPWKMYDESSESVLDTSLRRIFDAGIETVETHFDTVDNLSIDKDTQIEETVEVVRGTKRKRTGVSKSKDGKYQCCLLYTSAAADE